MRRTRRTARAAFGLGVVAMSDASLISVAPAGASTTTVTRDDEGDLDTVDPSTVTSTPDGDPLTVASTAAANGAATCGATTCSYVPDPGFSGTDTFTYTAGDGHGGLAIASVHVVVPTPPRPGGGGGGAGGTGPTTTTTAISGGALPRTGSDEGALLLVAVGLVLLGLGALLSLPSVPRSDPSG